MATVLALRVALVPGAHARLGLAAQLEYIGYFGVLDAVMPVPSTDADYWETTLAERGEGGFRLRSRDWDDYNKQIGDALEFEGLSRRQLELLQLAGYLGVFLRNGRLLDLARFTWRFRREGAAWLRKLLWPARWAAAPAVGGARDR